MLVVRLTDDPAGMYPTLKQRLVRLLEETHVGEILLDKGGFDPLILPVLRETIKKDGEKAAVHFITDKMVDAFYIVGPADHCKARLKNIVRLGWASRYYCRGWRIIEEWQKHSVNNQNVEAVFRLSNPRLTHPRRQRTSAPNSLQILLTL